MTSAMLHSLNAARVIAEYAVVHYHVAFLFPASKGLLSHYAVPDNLMSFFFVLSGFVAMHSNMDTDFAQRGNAVQFIMKRFGKTYGLYLCMYLADLPATIMQRPPNCDLFSLSIASQPLLMHSWLGSQHIGIANGVGWYLCTLYWIWLAFPYLPMRRCLEDYTWPKICAMYALSMLLWLVLAPYNIVYTRAVPLFRLPEFAMGCATAFTLQHKLHGALCSVGLLAFAAYAAYDYSNPHLWPSENLMGNCTLWIQRNNQEINPTIVLSKFSIVWACVIHWLAATELAGGPPCMVMRVLHFDCFKALSEFSLYIYLSHYTVACAIRTAAQCAGMFAWWDLDIMLIVVYAHAYVMSVGMQPFIDYAQTAIYRLITRRHRIDNVRFDCAISMCDATAGCETVSTQ